MGQTTNSKTKKEFCHKHVTDIFIFEKENSPALTTKPQNEKLTPTILFGLIGPLKLLPNVPLNVICVGH